MLTFFVENSSIHLLLVQYWNHILIVHKKQLVERNMVIEGFLLGVSHPISACDVFPYLSSHFPSLEDACTTNMDYKILSSNFLFFTVPFSISCF